MAGKSSRGDALFSFSCYHVGRKPAPDVTCRYACLCRLQSTFPMIDAFPLLTERRRHRGRRPPGAQKALGAYRLLAARPGQAREHTENDQEREDAHDVCHRVREPHGKGDGGNHQSVAGQPFQRQLRCPEVKHPPPCRGKRGCAGRFSEALYLAFYLSLYLTYFI